MDLTPPDEFHPQLRSRKVRETSRRSYQRILDEGLLSVQRMKVYVCLWEAGEPMTGTEVNNKLRGKSYHKRLSELQRLGVIEETGTRNCKITGHECAVWDVTGSLPKKVDGKASGPPRPDPDTIHLALLQVKSMENAWRDDNPGEEPSDEFFRVMKWLGYLAGKKKKR